MFDWFRNSAVVRSLIDRDDFVAVAAARGVFLPDCEQDAWRLDRTKQLCVFICTGKSRRRVLMSAGEVIFEFEKATDAARFRRVTSRARDVIVCR